MNEDSRKYFGFQLDGEYYTLTVLPFGWNFSPFYFCKTKRELVSYIRSLGFRVVAYADDLIVLDTLDIIR